MIIRQLKLDTYFLDNIFSPTLCKWEAKLVKCEEKGEQNIYVNEKKSFKCHCKDNLFPKLKIL